MSPLDARIKRVALETAKDWLNTNLPTILRRMAGIDLPDDAPRTPYQFVVRIQRELFRYGASKEYATEAGPRILREFLADEKVKFGDPAYAWDGHAAVTLAREYELDHWERQA